MTVRIRLLIAVVALGAGALQTQAADWGSVTIDSEKKIVTFENSRIKATYKPWGSENVIKELYAKPLTTNISGNCIDACASRKALTEAKIISELPDRITAELKWGSHTTSRITLYKDCPVIKIDQVSGNSPNIVDASAGFSKFAIYGSENWPRDPYKYRYPKCYYHTGDGHCAEQNGETKSADNPAPLLYHNWFINGIYKSDADGVGYGRVIDNKVKILKLLSWGGAGFEYFWNNHLSYLYVVKTGAPEIISMGKKIADWANGGEKGSPLGGASTAEGEPVSPRSGARSRIRFMQGLSGAGWVNVCDARGRTVVRLCGDNPSAPAHVPAGVYLVATRAGEIRSLVVTPHQTSRVRAGAENPF